MSTEVIAQGTFSGRHRAVAAGAVPTRRLVREQATVVTGQAIAGVGNMAFSLVAAHALPASQFAQLATFLALYLLLLLPSWGLAAGAAAHPDAALHGRSLAAATILGGAAIAAANRPLGSVLHLDGSLVALLGAALPAVTLLAIARGRLYGRQRHAVAVLTLVAEPAVRLGPGSLLLHVAGPAGAAVGVVAAGYVALLIATLGGRGGPVAAPIVGGTDSRGATVLTFTALAVLQNLDLILANRLLTHGAGTFAAVSTLGGIAAFATATIPLVLLPRSRTGNAGDGRALGVALGAAAVLGGGAVLLAALAPARAYGVVLGERYAGIGSIAVPYVAAMALFGVARVLSARLCTRGLGKLVAALVLAAVGTQTVWILAAPRTPSGVASGTELALAALTVGLGLAQAGDTARTAVVARRAEQHSRSPRRWWARREVLLVAGLMAIAAVLRALVTRGLWVDEATSVAQANMPYHAMLQNLRNTDVHPPGYFTLLWGWVRVFGDGPLAVRMPSVLAGVALVPAVYGAARELFDRRTARIAAALSVLAPQAVWYSQEARMYALFMLLVVLAVWAQARILHGHRLGAWAAYTAASVALIYTQYFGTLVVLAQQVVFLVAAVRQRRAGARLLPDVLRWLVSVVVGAAALTPLVPFLAHQFAVNQAAGKGFGTPTNTGAGASVTPPGPSIYALLANFIWAATGYHSDAVMKVLGAMWPLTMLLALALLGRGRSRAVHMVLWIAVFPLLALFAAGQQKSFVFDLRYFIGIVPLLVILGARAAASWSRRPVGAALLAGLLTAALAAGLYDQQVNGENPRRFDFAPALSRIAATAQPGDKVVLSPEYLATVSKYYQPSLHYVIDKGRTEALRTAVRSAPRVYLVGSFFTVGNERARLRELLTTLGHARVREHVWRFDNVTVWELR